MKRIFVEYQDEPKVLIDHLEANADKVVEDYHYIREMTEIERVELETRYLEFSKKMDALQEEFKLIKEEFDGKINPIKKANQPGHQNHSPGKDPRKWHCLHHGQLRRARN